jgi:hypothetical protein
MTLRSKIFAHGHFLHLLILFITFRCCSVLFFRPGGYTRDYSDLIYYQGRASWQDFGLLPYRDYWSEYPPLFAWFSLWIDRWSRRIPLWEDERLWYAAIFGLSMVVAETITLLCLYQLAQRLHGGRALQVAWLYTGLFLPVYFLSGWYDALAVATLLVGLWLLVEHPNMRGAFLAGLALGVGGLLKLVPLALLALLPLALARWSHRLLAGGLALLVLIGGYGWAYLHGPVMTLASLRSLDERSGWSTLYAWVNGYTRLGKVLGDVFDPAARIRQYESIYPQEWVLGAWLVLGALVWIVLWRRQAASHPVETLVGFAAFTYTLLLLAYPAWNPQYALYLLPFLVLLWPTGRGLCYALSLSLLVLVEHPIYHNLIGPDYAPVARMLIDVDYQPLFLAIIVARTAILAAIALDLGLTLLPWLPRLRWLPVAVSIVAVVVMVALTPQMGRAYVAGRLATSTVRPLALYLNTLDAELPVVAQQLSLGRHLRPFLTNQVRLTLFGGRPGRIDPLPAVAARGPFVYLQSGDDDPALAEQVAQAYACQDGLALSDWLLRFCNAPQLPTIARWAQGIELMGATLPRSADGPLHITLFWHTTQPVEQDYTVFVHVVGADGAMLGQWDQTPGAGVFPTTGWATDQLVVDDYQINLMVDQPPQRILVGLYDPTTGDRLAVVETQYPVADDRLTLRAFQ